MGTRFASLLSKEQGFYKLRRKFSRLCTEVQESKVLKSVPIQALGQRRREVVFAADLAGHICVLPPLTKTEQSIFVLSRKRFRLQIR